MLLSLWPVSSPVSAFVMMVIVMVVSKNDSVDIYKVEFVRLLL